MFMPATVVKKQHIQPVPMEPTSDYHKQSKADILRDEYDSGLDCPDTLDDEGVVYEWE